MLIIVLYHCYALLKIPHPRPSPQGRGERHEFDNDRALIELYRRLYVIYMR